MAQTQKTKEQAGCSDSQVVAGAVALCAECQQATADVSRLPESAISNVSVFNQCHTVIFR